jgi:phosphoribosyl-AMP cyclohydrolase / phosphoribosyl-ATP pyrophosphohydrolase
VSEHAARPPFGMEPPLDLSEVDFDKDNGLVVVVTQDAIAGSVLMTAFADREALQRTLETGEMHYRSRSRGLWHKGATSGNVQRVVSLTLDCDSDAVLARVVPAGPACHTGAVSCFGEAGQRADVLAELDAVVAERASGERVSDSNDAGVPVPSVEASPPSYTRRLLGDRNLRLKKIGEEVAELVLACADEDKQRAIAEAADVIYHVVVALRAVGASFDDVRSELRART